MIENVICSVIDASQRFGDEHPVAAHRIGCVLFAALIIVGCCIEGI